MVQDGTGQADQEEDDVRTHRRHEAQARHGGLRTFQDDRHQGNPLVSEVQDGEIDFGVVL